MEVLDVCCGMGGSALPAAERVGPSGHVVAVDLAKNLLDKGARRAAQRGLANIEFRRADLENLPFADSSFDAVICVFGIFFVPDLHGAVRGLWRLVRPAGFLAITIWGAKMFEPAEDKFWEAVRQEDPALLKSIKPWNKIVNRNWSSRPLPLVMCPSTTKSFPTRTKSLFSSPVRHSFLCSHAYRSSFSLC
jgi:ubiquinone/menaquinone biosynthesis C-methylase UbiE